eukprot:6044627-Karenia_brevis.AAC.1
MALALGPVQWMWGRIPPLVLLNFVRQAGQSAKQSPTPPPPATKKMIGPCSSDARSEPDPRK